MLSCSINKARYDSLPLLGSTFFPYDRSGRINERHHIVYIYARQTVAERADLIPLAFDHDFPGGIDVSPFPLIVHDRLLSFGKEAAIGWIGIDVYSFCQRKDFISLGIHQACVKTRTKKRNSFRQKAVVCKRTVERFLNRAACINQHRASVFHSDCPLAFKMVGRIENRR